MKTREEIKTEFETKGVKAFSSVEILLDIRDLLEKILNKNDNAK